MSNSFIFDYNQFYNYYTDKSNPYIYTDLKPPITYYYKKASSKIHTNNSLKEYILINNDKYYITKNKGHILFTFPVLIDGNYWDFHYHFGIISNFKDKVSKKLIDVIFFHKTEQNPNKKEKNSFNCYFPDKIEIINVADIICIQETSNKMGNKFPIADNDFKNIEEIIRQPFIGLRKGGSNKTIRSKKIIKKRTMKNIHKRTRETNKYF
jgi:hypothetical protein